jgi:hypothetical protein
VVSKLDIKINYGIYKSVKQALKIITFKCVDFGNVNLIDVTEGVAQLRPQIFKLLIRQVLLSDR